MWQGMTPLGEVWMGIYVHSVNQTPTVMSRIVADSLTEMRWQQWCILHHFLPLKFTKIWEIFPPARLFQPARLLGRLK